MSTFDTAKDNYHIRGMDNIYNYANFCKMDFNHPNKVMVNGVTQKIMNGIPAYVIQE